MTAPDEPRATVRCQVEVFASLRERAGRSSLGTFELPRGSAVAQLKELVLARHPELRSLAAVRAVLGTAYVRDEALIEDGATVHLLPPVSGGGDAGADAARDFERGVFELSAAPLDPGAAFARVADPQCGGTVVFSGTTRASNRDRTVVRLDYEAFERMCGPQMARIFERCLAEFGPAAPLPGEPAARRLRMLVQHRTGVVDVGETSVVVAVASPHRDAAFRAARFLIDELKASLPVWKKECYADGHEWIGEGA